MDRNSNQYVVLFAVGICVVLAVLLAGAYSALSESIASNEEFDRQRNILKAVGLWDPSQAKTREELEAMFAQSVEPKVLEVKRAIVEEQVKRAGELVTDKVEKVVDVVETDIAVADLADVLREEEKKPEDERRELVPFFTRKDAAGNAEAFCIPISGYGLWSTLYGYLAVRSDANHVAGITFYKHGETPGLGGEVENPAWQAQWEGKEILDAAGNLVGINVKKGGADPQNPHAVDGLSGATITSDGVTRFVYRDLATYLPYMKKQ